MTCRQETTHLRTKAALIDCTAFEASDCITIASHQNEPPSSASGDEVVLKPAVPNPFNPVTRISYYLPREEFVELSIFDVTGALVQKLVATQQAAGEYIIEWDASSQASGIYFYRIEVGDFVQTRKLILLK